MEGEESSRAKKNESVKKCRERKRAAEEETKIKTKKLKEDNAARELNIEAYNNELKFFTNVVNSFKEANNGSTKEVPEFKALQSMAKEAPDVNTKATGSKGEVQDAVKKTHEIKTKGTKDEEETNSQKM